MIESTKVTEEEILLDENSNYAGDGLEERVDKYKEKAINEIKFTVIIKPAIISFVALLLSFFLDLSYVPLLGNITVDIAQILFPGWQPAVETFTPYSFWWVPVLIYIFFVGLGYLTYQKLKTEVMRTPATETIDKIIGSYTTVIDSISMALPLIGAALLLISIKLGEEVFLGLSVPFEVKALIVLALGKLFEPVLDQLGLEFQNVVNHINEMRDKYYSKLQVRNTQSIIKQLSSRNAQSSKVPEISMADLEKYREILNQTSQLSGEILNNFDKLYSLLEKMSTIQNISSEKIDELKSLANSITTASASLSDEKTLSGLKSLESIVIRK